MLHLFGPVFLAITHAFHKLCIFLIDSISKLQRHLSQLKDIYNKYNSII